MFFKSALAFSLLFRTAPPQISEETCYATVGGDRRNGESGGCGESRRMVNKTRGDEEADPDDGYLFDEDLVDK